MPILRMTYSREPSFVQNGFRMLADEVRQVYA